MRIHLDYGREGLDADLPDDNLRHILGIKPADPLPDIAAALKWSLAHPIGTPPLSELARNRRDACIIICDITRPVPNGPILEQMLAILTESGLPPEKVTILIATGTHRPNEGEELREMVGDAVLQSGVRIVNHVCTDPETNRFVETTPRGVPVSLDTRWLDADLRITVGLIEPHFMAGYSGGRKLIMPGVAALETVQYWHSPRFLEHPNATNGALEGNPVHEENTYIARLAPSHFITDVTLDAQRRVTGVFSGGMEDAWRAGVNFVAHQVRAEIEEPVDIAVTSAGGYPLDATFYQVVKGIVGAIPIVKPGGDIIIVAGMSEGIGSTHFRETLFETDDLQALVQQMSEPDWKYIPDQWQVEELAKATRQHRVTVVTDAVAPEDLARCHVRPAATVEEAVAFALRQHGANASVAVIPKGPYVIPCLK
jgi:nickel-dependent lactate racemase